MFPSQCIARHTEELYEVQGNTSPHLDSSPLSLDTDEASSRRLHDFSRASSAWPNRCQPVAHSALQPPRHPPPACAHVASKPPTAPRATKSLWTRPPRGLDAVAPAPHPRSNSVLPDAHLHGCGCLTWSCMSRSKSLSKAWLRWTASRSSFLSSEM
jgi:hypothetical protein